MDKDLRHRNKEEANFGFGERRESEKSSWRGCHFVLILGASDTAVNKKDEVHVLVWFPCRV